MICTAQPLGAYTSVLLTRVCGHALDPAAPLGLTNHRLSFALYLTELYTEDRL